MAEACCVSEHENGERQKYEMNTANDEARRIADELHKLHRDGAIKTAEDAAFYARLICDFGATYTPPPKRSDLNADRKAG